MNVSAETQKKRITSFLATEWYRLVGYVRAWIDDSADRDAEDVVQDVIERLYERADVTEPIADISAYLYHALRNRIVDLYRKGKRNVELPEDIADPRYEIAEDLEREEALLELTSAIEELPPAQREVLVATEFEGRGFKELAAEWKTPIGTLLARKHRAIQSLRETLAGGDE
jgi:RNA polymerase sigma factor (sigma-70 family)